MTWHRSGWRCPANPGSTPAVVRRHHKNPAPHCRAAGLFGGFLHSWPLLTVAGPLLCSPSPVPSAQAGGVQGTPKLSILVSPRLRRG